MTDPINQTENENSNKPKTNLTLIFEHLKPEWKADYLKIVLGKYAILFYAFIFILLWQIFYDVFDGIIVKIFKYTVAHIPINTITSCLFVFIAIGTIIVYCNKIGKIQYRPNLNFSFTVLFVGIIYFPLRWSDKWGFNTLWSLPIAQADIYLLFLIGEIWSWAKFLLITHPDKMPNGKSFGLDDPDDNEDEFGRKDFATDITEFICNSFGQRSLAIGISGSWGTGKSYLLNQIQKSLNAKNDRSILVIKFNPWRSSTHNRIVEDFLQTIKTALGVYDKSLSDKFERYLKVLIETDKTNWIKTIADTLSSSGDKSSEQLYNEINDCLQLIHKRLVIFIDDLDRLHNEEIIEVFRIVRNTADFYNTCFVVAYDREYVQNTFLSSNLQMSNYLDKIFQTEFVLPTIDPNILINVIIDEVLNHFRDNSILNHKLKQIFSDSTKKELILDFILHRRDAIRFANMLSFDINSIQSNIDYGEFMFVILLKMKFPTVYNILHFRDNRNTFLEAKLVDGKRLYKIQPDGYEALRNRNPKIFEPLNTTSIETVNRLFIELFEKGNDYSTKSIRYVENYYRYFSLTISSKDISNEEFWSIISKAFNEAKTEIDKWYKEKSKGSLDIYFLNYKMSEFEEVHQIKNYIYGMKKACIKINLKEAVTKFHVALKNGGFYFDNFKSFFQNTSTDDIDNLIVDIVFPEGVMDGFNWIVIEQLYKEGIDSSNLYSEEKSKQLVISRFYEILHSGNLNWLFDTWALITSGKDFDKWTNDIAALTNEFANLIIEKKEKFKPIIASRVKDEINLEKSDKNKAVLKGNSYKKEYNILKDVADILSNKFLHLPKNGKNALQKDKKFRILFYRELIGDLKLPSYHLSNFIDLFGPQMESYKEYKIYEASLLDIYPLNKNEFEKIDTELFDAISAEFIFRVDLRNKGKSKLNLE